MNHEYIREACIAAQEDLHLERVEELTGLDLSEERGKAQQRVRDITRKNECLEAIRHYRRKRRWAGGPPVPERVRDVIRSSKNQRTEQLVRIVGDRVGWSDEAWA